jgi:hypothetical protein
MMINVYAKDADEKFSCDYDAFWFTSRMIGLEQA